VVFNNQPNYQSLTHNKLNLELNGSWPWFLDFASYIYSHTVHLPVAIDTNLQDPGFVTVP